MKCVLKYTVFLFSFAFLDGVQFRCDYKYTNVGWFKYHEIPATWEDARLRCHLEGGILASPTTPQVRSVMLEFFCKPEIFIGMSAMYSRGEYYTIDGVPLAEIPHEWAPFEPDNKNNEENCTTLNTDGKLSDVRCDEPRPYLCHRADSKVDVNICGTTDPEYHFETQTNKCYKLHTKARNFERAHFTCSAEGAYLAIIKSDEEARLIAQIFAKYPRGSIIGSPHPDIAIIGYIFWKANSEWSTIHGQSIQDAGYAKFAPGQPDNANNREYCGTVFRTGLLNDGDCNVNYAFICEKAPNSPPVCQNIPDTNHIRFCDNDVEDQTKRLNSVNDNIVFS